LANRITVSRFPLLLIYVLVLYLAPPAWRLAAVALLFLGLLLDTVDGLVARRSGQTTLIGSVLDIAADRTYELVLWVCFADLRLIPVAIPLIVIMRTTLTDALRSIGVAQGQAPFQQHRTRLGKFLVASGGMRFGYSVSKITAFVGLAVAEALAGFDPVTPLGEAAAPILRVAQVIAWIAVAMCVLRGLPVIVGAIRRYWPGSPPPGGSSPT
jgi:CDP-diacylglycerol--glycerol-3-phosphate 3-phosphatidyltransferase